MNYFQLHNKENSLNPHIIDFWKHLSLDWTKNWGYPILVSKKFMQNEWKIIETYENKPW